MPGILFLRLNPGGEKMFWKKEIENADRPDRESKGKRALALLKSGTPPTITLLDQVGSEFTSMMGFLEFLGHPAIIQVPLEVWVSWSDFGSRDSFRNTKDGLSTRIRFTEVVCPVPKGQRKNIDLTGIK